jgi:tRNA(Arg) A34 adenosine deaminase TadA
MELFSEETINEYMKEALAECQKSLDEGEVPVGCVFISLDDMKIVARGHNRTNATKNATTHAEINCINDLFSKCDKNIFENCVLFVSCEPCIMCAYALSLVSMKYII